MKYIHRTQCTSGVHGRSTPGRIVLSAGLVFNEKFSSVRLLPYLPLQNGREPRYSLWLNGVYETRIKSET